MTPEEIGQQNELTLRSIADEAARHAKTYADLVKRIEAMEDPEPGALEVAKRGEDVHSAAAAEWQLQAEDPPTDRLLDRGEMWNEFVRRNNESDGLGPNPD